MTRQLKLISPAKPRLGLYLRPGRNDHTTILRLLAEDRAVSGLVLDARHAERHKELREALVDNGVHAVLDPDLMEASTPGGSRLSGVDGLPWAPFARLSPNELRGPKGRELAEAIADATLAGQFSAVLAPTHYLAGPEDPYFAADRTVVAYLRRALDSRGLAECSIFYPLAMPAAALRSRVQRVLVIEGLRGSDVDAVWMRLHPFGSSSSGPVALRRYLDAAWELGAIGKPMVGEHTGTVGLALMAFGAVGGIESGITLGERFDASSLLKERPDGDPFARGPRVYLHTLGAMVDKKVAVRAFEQRQILAALACRDTVCCRDGANATLRDPRRHFVIRRLADVERIGAVPAGSRATVYLHDTLQPAALLAVRMSRAVSELEPVQRRLEGWHQTLGAIGTRGLPAPIPALGHRVGISRPKPQSL